MTDIKKLRELAVKATPGPKYFTVEDTFPTIWLTDDSGERYDFTLDDLSFWEAANPQAIIEVLDMVDRYREALQFYACKENWTTGTSITFSAIRCSNFPMGDTDSDFDKARDGYIGGRRAREALEGGK